MELLETMRVEAGGAIPLLPRHLERLGRSARFFGFSYDSDGIPAAILGAASRQTEAVVLRLVLAKEGDFQLQTKPLPEPGMPSRLVLARSRVNSADPMLRHKTTARTVYDRAREGYDASTDVILVNERGEITETTIANIAVFRDGRWMTPPISCGVLPGTMRAQLLDEGKIVEGAIPAAELIHGEPVRFFNAVRGVFDVIYSLSDHMVGFMEQSRVAHELSSRHGWSANQYAAKFAAEALAKGLTKEADFWKSVELALTPRDNP